MNQLARIFAASILAIWMQASAAEDTVRIAVAANFKPVLEQLTAMYVQTRPTQFVVSAGASGALYAQIKSGAPFELFFSADVARAEQLERDGAAVAGTRFTYAIGKLVLWTPGRAIGGDLERTLSDARIRTVAIANPATAPYGAAAEEVLRRLGLHSRFKVVRGENVGQTFQFLSTGNADAGFVARSQIRDYERLNKRSLAAETLAVDAKLHAPIEQQAVLLTAGEANPSARDFLQFIQSEAAQRFITAAGYGSPSWTPPDCRGCERPGSAREDARRQ